jgi:hypothetical protein
LGYGAPGASGASGWTIDTLHEHLLALLAEMDRRLTAAIAAQDKAVQIAMIASEKAVVKAETAAERRFENVNEFRGQLADQAATFMPRAEAEQRMGQLDKAVGSLEVAVSSSGGRAGGVSASWAMMLGLGGLVITLVGVAVAVLVAANT